MRTVDLNPPLRSTRNAVGIQDFFLSVEDAMALHLKSGVTPGSHNPTLAHSFPKDRFQKPDDPFDLITYRVLSSRMAPSDNTGNRVPRAPTLREAKPHPELERYQLHIYGWWELAQIEFSVWSRSNARADDVTAWFHSFMMKYAFPLKYFQSRGIDYFRFVERQDDDIDFNTGQEIYRRRLVYEIRLEMLDAVEKKTLESINLNIVSNRSTDLIELTDNS